jgi:hypothetical protein
MSSLGCKDSVVVSQVVNPALMLTITNASVCEDEVELTWTGATGVTLENITAAIVGENSCDKCSDGSTTKWVNMTVSSPTSETAGSYTGKITNIAPGTWTFHINSVTTGSCVLSNPTTTNVTTCPE